MGRLEAGCRHSYSLTHYILVGPRGFPPLDPVARLRQGPVRKHDISNSSSSRPSKQSFATFGLHKQLLRAIAEAGFSEPRPIQAKAIPAVLRGRDVLGLAQTGTGKTAAFILPILEGLIESGGRGPSTLIVAPTRELALQIHAESELLGKFTKARAVTVFGGVGAGKQIQALRGNPDIIVACPGRLLDLHSSGQVSLDRIDTLVLDEVDHMFDMGFIPDLRRILRALPERRQNLFFSATMPHEIRKLADRVLREPYTIELGHSAPAETVDHFLYPVAQPDKTRLLLHLLKDRQFDSAIVFLRTKHRARRLAQLLERAGMSAVALQGNMSQGQRQRAMQGFRDGKFQVLVATDIAARGIDVQRVSLVINYDVPNTPDAYTHRIGRTGRSERSGEALTFVTPDDFSAIKEIEKRIGMKVPRRKVKDFTVEEQGESGRGQAGHGGGGHRRGGRGSRGARRRRGGAASGERSGRQGGSGHSEFGAGLGGGSSRSSGNRAGGGPGRRGSGRRARGRAGRGRRGRR